MTNIIAKFTEHTGIVEIGAGYDNISTYRVEDLRSLLADIKDGTEVMLATIPHKEGGNALLMRPRKRKEPQWACCCPIIKQRKKRDYPLPIPEGE